MPPMCCAAHAKDDGDAPLWDPDTMCCDLFCAQRAQRPHGRIDAALDAVAACGALTDAQVGALRVAHHDTTTLTVDGVRYATSQGVRLVTRARRQLEIHAAETKRGALGHHHAALRHVEFALDALATEWADEGGLLFAANAVGACVFMRQWLETKGRDGCDLNDVLMFHLCGVVHAPRRGSPTLAARATVALCLANAALKRAYDPAAYPPVRSAPPRAAAASLPSTPIVLSECSTPTTPDAFVKEGIDVGTQTETIAAALATECRCCGWRTLATTLAAT